MGRVEQLLDESVAAQEYLIPESDAEALFDLAAVDWKGLEEAFKQGRPRTAAQRLRSLLSARITALVRLNPSRVDLVERFEKLVADYNAGSINTETFFQELLEFSNDADRGGGAVAVRGTDRGAARHLRPADAPGTRAVRGREGSGEEGGRGTAGGPEARQDRPRLAQSSRPRAQPYAWPSRRPSTGCRRSSRDRSTPRNATSCISTSSTATGTTGTRCTTGRHNDTLPSCLALSDSSNDHGPAWLRPFGPWHAAKLTPSGITCMASRRFICLLRSADR